MAENDDGMPEPDAGMMPDPEYGMLRGRPVLLATVLEKYGQHDLEQIEVEFPDGRTIRPWRFASSGSEITINADGVICI